MKADSNSLAERFVGTCRREVLDHLLIFSARHLEAVIKEFLVHYHQARPHQGLDQRCPDPVPAVIPLPVVSKIVRNDRLGGLLHEYSLGRVIELTGMGLPHTLAVQGLASVVMPSTPTRWAPPFGGRAFAT